MQHLPFEDWIFSPESLSPLEAQSLEGHLAECRACRGLATSFRKSEAFLQEAALFDPPAGFLKRWRDYREVRAVQERLWQAWLVLAVSGLGALALAAVLGIQGVAFLLSPVRFAVELVHLAADWAAQVTILREVVGVVYLGVGATIPPFVWASLIVGLGMLSALWVFAISRFGVQGATE